MTLGREAIIDSMGRVKLGFQTFCEVDGSDRVRVLVDDLVSVGAYHIIRRIPVYDCVDIDLLEIDALVVLQVQKNFFVQISAFLRWLPILQDLTVEVLVERAGCD